MKDVRELVAGITRRMDPPERLQDIENSARRVTGSSNPA
jgi:hypothetical protein